jgi:hypothetical protein
MKQFDDDPDEMRRHIKAYQIASLSPLMLAKCAAMNGTLQSACEVCTNPDVPCIGCIRRRNQDSSIPTADCPNCWHSPNKMCPSR